MIQTDLSTKTGQTALFIFKDIICILKYLNIFGKIFFEFLFSKQNYGLSFNFIIERLNKKSKKHSYLYALKERGSDGSLIDKKKLF